MMLAVVQNGVVAPTQVIINLSQIASAILIISSFVLALVQTFTKYNPFNGIRNWINEPVMKKVSEIESNVEKLTISNLKSSVCNPYLPRNERVSAGDIYVGEYGLNGTVKAVYKTLLEETEAEAREDLKSKRRR